MCIAIISTAHPAYAFIILSNRDEILDRPTQPLAPWSSAPHIYSGRDLRHPAHGTWLGLTDYGRLAILTNFREEDAPQPPPNAPSRGELPSVFLSTDPAQAQHEGLEGFAKRLLQDEGSTWNNVGGFSLIFGDVRPWSTAKHRMGIISNRTPDVHGVVWVDEGDGIGVEAADGPGKTWGQTCALSNSRYGDRMWPKVVAGEKLLNDKIDQSVKEQMGEDELIASCFGILSRDSLRDREPGEDWEVYLRQLRTTIYVPPIGQDSKGRPAYGTQKQTVILIRTDGHAVMIERTLWDEHVQPVKDDRRFEFKLRDA